MSSACMTPSTVSEQQWVLYTSNCDSVYPTSKIYNFSDKVQPNTTVGYYFAFAAGSHVAVTFPQQQQGTATVKYLVEKDPRKAINLDKDCARKGREIPKTVFYEDGYYYICITSSGDSPSSYSLTVHEHYYHHEIINECNNTIYQDGVEHMCCHFRFGETFAHHHCIYLTTRNTDPQHCEKPESVKVYMTYSDIMKTLAWGAMASVIIVAFFVFIFSCIFICWVRCTCRCTKNQGANIV